MAGDITVTVHRDETGERLTVDAPWPDEVEITTEAVEKARTDVLDRHGDRLIFTLYNGGAIYQIEREDDWRGVLVCRLVDSTYVPASDLIDPAPASERTTDQPGGQR